MNENQTRSKKTIITFGTFDLFHIGHLEILKRAREMGDRLVVGVSSDALTHAKKARYPIQSESERMAIVSAMRCVDHVFLEESLEGKRDYVLEHGADVLVMGDDWHGRFDNELEGACTVTYLPRTPSVCTTERIEMCSRVASSSTRE